MDNTRGDGKDKARSWDMERRMRAIQNFALQAQSDLYDKNLTASLESVTLHLERIYLLSSQCDEFLEKNIKLFTPMKGF